MPKLFAKMKIIRVNKEVEEVIEPRTVFDATVAEAKQFDALPNKPARPATADEIKAHDERVALDNGETFQAPAPSDPVLADPEPAAPMPDSGASGDPKSAPKGRSA